MTAPAPGDLPSVWAPVEVERPRVTAPVGRRWLAVVVAGAIALLVGVILGISSIPAVLGTPVLSGAGTISEHGHAGTYYVYAQTGSTRSLGPVTVSTFAPVDVEAAATHVSLDGRPLAITPYEHSYGSTIDRGSRHFSAIAQVYLPHGGTLSLTADHDEGALVIAPTIGEAAKGLIVPGVIALGGLLLAGSAALWRARTRRRGAVG